MTTLFPVIMAGGSGTRFWPLSRRSRPKQFLPLTSSKPLIAETFARVGGGLAKPKNVLVVCGKAHVKAVRAAVKALPADNVLVEPAARNTAAAIGLAAIHVHRRDPEGVLLVLPSDHHVANVTALKKLLAKAAEVASGGALVTVGITPRSPETGYGYLRVGEKLPSGAHAVAAFVEKPDLATAQKYLASGEYLWNGGIFAFRADAILNAFAEHMPELAEGLATIANAVGKRTYASVLERVFPKLPSTSIDYGVMEKAKNIAMVSGEFGWSDVGSFAALPEVRKPDARGNVVSGKSAVVIDCSGCVVLAHERPLAVVGLTDAIVVDSGDAVLVLPKGRSQDVRQVVEALTARKLTEYL